MNTQAKNEQTNSHSPQDDMLAAVERMESDTPRPEVLRVMLDDLLAVLSGIPSTAQRRLRERGVMEPSVGTLRTAVCTLLRIWAKESRAVVITIGEGGVEEAQPLPPDPQVARVGALARRFLDGGYA